jgi:hypothetical protein
VRRSLVVIAVGISVLVAPTGNASAATRAVIARFSVAGGPRTIVEVSTRPEGQEIAAQAAARHSARGIATTASQLRVWRIGHGDYVAGRQLPVGLEVGGPDPDGGVVSLTYEVGGRLIAARPRRTARLASTAATWVWLAQGCFSRLTNGKAWLDSCYALHGLTNESDPRDFYQLEQYGSLAPTQLFKIYDGWLAARPASGSSPMSWIDWSPRGSKSGPCQTIPLSVRALDVSISASGLMCEHWNIAKGVAAGEFQEQWSCGCIYPFGQPYPNIREIDSMQVVSVPSGGIVRWTLAAGFSTM